MWDRIDGPPAAQLAGLKRAEMQQDSYRNYHVKTLANSVGELVSGLAGNADFCAERRVLSGQVDGRRRFQYWTIWNVFLFTCFVG